MGLRICMDVNDRVAATTGCCIRGVTIITTK